MEANHYCKTLDHAKVCGRSSKLNPVEITYRTDLKIWEVIHDYTYPVGMGVVLRIPAGFRFDLASIPKILWNVIAPFELSVVAPLIHDAMYNFGGKFPDEYIAHAAKQKIFTRKEADIIFYNLMIEEQVGGLKSRIAYNAVRIFGRPHWNRYDNKFKKGQ